MGREFSAIAAAMLLCAAHPAQAATFAISLSDQNGRPVENAVVTLMPQNRSGMPEPAGRLPNEKKIDQRNETFIPLVTVVPKGGRVIFENNDQTTHQVYSFSAAKQFEITLNRGQDSSPIPFDNAGIAALGCNIHDHMIAYVFVAESPWTALSGTNGKAAVELPPGNYQMQIWHPRLPGGRPPPPAPVTINAQDATLPVMLRLSSPPPATRSHSGGY
jgi:plastocyanin